MRGDRERVLDMIEMCDLLLAHVSDPALLDTDPVVQAAAQRWVEILGEAAANVSTGVTSAHSEVPWRDIVGTRVILAHAYFHIDPGVLRSVLTEDIPRLRTQLIAIERELTDDP